MRRKDRLIQESHHDPYFTKKKHTGTSICTNCGVGFKNGIFGWLDNIPENAVKITCPACRKITDKFEGGTVTLEGNFLTRHKEEILNIISNTKESEMRSRPLEKIMEIIDRGNRIEIKTTYEHLARRIGVAIHKAYKGSLNIEYLADEKYTRVCWMR